MQISPSGKRRDVEKLAQPEPGGDDVDVFEAFDRPEPGPSGQSDEAFFEEYARAALDFGSWKGRGGTVADISPEALETMREDASSFLRENMNKIPDTMPGSIPSTAGYAFFRARNGLTGGAGGGRGFHNTEYQSDTPMYIHGDELERSARAYGPYQFGFDEEQRKYTNPEGEPESWAVGEYEGRPESEFERNKIRGSEVRPASSNSKVKVAGFGPSDIATTKRTCPRCGDVEVELNGSSDCPKCGSETQPRKDPEAVYMSSEGEVKVAGFPGAEKPGVKCPRCKVGKIVGDTCENCHGSRPKGPVPPKIDKPEDMETVEPMESGAGSSSEVKVAGWPRNPEEEARQTTGLGLDPLAPDPSRPQCPECYSSRGFDESGTCMDCRRGKKPGGRGMQTEFESMQDPTRGKADGLVKAAAFDIVEKKCTACGETSKTDPQNEICPSCGDPYPQGGPFDPLPKEEPMEEWEYQSAGNGIVGVGKVASWADKLNEEGLS